MHTASVPGSAKQRSTRSSPKKCDLPEPRPPYAPLYLAGRSSGRNTFAVGIFSVDDDTFYPFDLERLVIFAGDLERQQPRIDARPESALVTGIFFHPCGEAFRSADLLRR